MLCLFLVHATRETFSVDILAGLAAVIAVRGTMHTACVHLSTDCCSIAQSNLINTVI